MVDVSLGAKSRLSVASTIRAAGQKVRELACRIPGRDRANRTAAAFVAVIVFAEISPVIPHSPAPKVGWWLGGLATTAAAGAIAVAARRHHSGAMRYLPLMLFLIAVQMLRAADGNGSAGFTPLLVLPVAWYALYGSTLAVIVALVGVGAVQFGPLILVGAPQYPVTLWRAAVLWVAILALIGLVAHRLVTAIRRKSAALAVSDAQFRSAFCDAPAAVAVIGAAGAQHGVFLKVNRALAALLGRAPDAIVNRSVLEFTHPDDRELTVKHLLAPPERQMCWTIEKRYLHSSGRCIPVRITYSEFQDCLAADPCVVAHIEDVSEHRDAQLEMLRALEQEKEATARLRRLAQASSNLAFTVGSEVQGPLGNISRAVGVLMPLTAGRLTADELSVLAAVGHDAESLAGILAKLNTAPPPMADLPDDTVDPVDVEAVVCAAIESVRPVAHGRELALQYDVSLAGAEVEGNAAKLDRALMSLLDNAVKFTPRGGAIDAQARIRRDAVVIDVTDTGIGVSREDKDRIFEKFYRAHEVERRSIPGAGLGLTIAKAIIEQHHGSIEVFSEPGAGSTFTVVLPLRQELART